MQLPEHRHPLQGWADGLMAAAATLPDEQHSQEAAAAQRANELLERAVTAFQQVGIRSLLLQLVTSLSSTPCAVESSTGLVL